MKLKKLFLITVGLSQRQLVNIMEQSFYWLLETLFREQTQKPKGIISRGGTQNNGINNQTSGNKRKNQKVL